MPIRNEDIPVAGPWITEVEINFVLDALQNGWYGKDAYRYVELFENEFAAYHGRKHALMTPNCTSAIHLLLSALDINEGDEVIVPDCTWIATAAPIVYRRARPVFCDIDPVHWCLDPAAVEKKITPKTKAVMVVDLYGNMPDMTALKRVCDKRGLPLIEDAAESLGSVYDGKKAGSFGIASVFSFHRTKSLTTGEGGMLVLDDESLFQRCKFLRDHGRAPGKTYYNDEVAYKYMPSNLQAALGHGQFTRLHEIIGKKREIFALYRRELAGLTDVCLNPEPANVFNSFWMTTLVLGKSYGLNKDEAIRRLEKLGLPARPFFYPLSSLPAFPGYESCRQENPVAYDVSDRAINLPSALNLTSEQILAVCEGVKKIL